MEKVSAHVHPGPLVPNVLTRQHKHRSGVIWSEDHETCITDIQCRHFDRNLFQAYSTAHHRLIDIIDSTRLGKSYLPDMSGNLIHVRYISLLEDFDAINTYSWGSCGCTTERGKPCATSDLGLVVYSFIAPSVRSACGTRPLCSTWCYVVHII
ncbi:hypothetical protein M9H77_08844 [Catharanthus roseus]|uniref:Uncharacterized protein n=1 Tax=Catharanthus roseus TaxID=4058 RepID=A0ACC0BZ90_CATRO|nr:hypothetical protein M9H77_08844 [Catharanthus roseus]